MKRVAVIGCPGAGKTTFTRKLHEKTGLPVIHLDFYYHQKKFDFYNNREAWISCVEKLINEDSWIMDGNYSSTFEQRFKRADTIIFFDYPRRISFYRTIKRRIEFRNSHRAEMPSDWKEKADKDFLKYVWNFNRDSRSRITEQLKKNKDKNIIIFLAPKQAEDYLRML